MNEVIAAVCWLGALVTFLVMAIADLRYARSELRDMRKEDEARCTNVLSVKKDM